MTYDPTIALSVLAARSGLPFSAVKAMTDHQRHDLQMDCGLKEFYDDKEINHTPIYNTCSACGNNELVNPLEDHRVCHHCGHTRY